RAHGQHPSEDLFCPTRSEAGHSSWVRRHTASPAADRLTGSIGHDHDGEGRLSKASFQDGPRGRDGDLYPFHRQDSRESSERNPRSGCHCTSPCPLLGSYPTAAPSSKREILQRSC